MTRITNNAAWLGLIFGIACLTACNDQSDTGTITFESMYTSIDSGSCTEHIDEDDPNETTIRLCPGVLGYAVVLRHVGSGRLSVDVRTPGNGDFPLDYQDYVTRHMSQLEAQAEWRVMTKDGGKTPVALIIGVQAHENEDEPEAITRTYLAVAKITPDEICVTDSIVKASQYQSELQGAADTAPESDCMELQPMIAIDGEFDP